MDGFKNAIAAMSGDSISDMVHCISVNDVVDIVDFAISCVAKGDGSDAIGKLRSVRDIVRDADYTRDKLNSVLGLDSDDSQLMPTELQLRRFQETNYTMYSEYVKGENMENARKIIKEIMDKFPTPPKQPLVIRDAKASAAFLTCYQSYIHTMGGREGAGLAWTNNGDSVIVLHFVDGFFDAGIEIPNSGVSALLGLYNDGEEAVISKDWYYGDIDLRLTADEQNTYVITMNGEKVMTITRKMLGVIVDSASEKKREYSPVFQSMRSNLIYAKDE